MHRCRHVVFTAVCGGWALLAVWGNLAAMGNDSPTSNPNPATSRAEVKNLVWLPQRSARPSAQGAERPLREQAEPRSLEVESVRPDPSKAAVLGAPVAEARRAESAESILPAGGVFADPFGDGSPAVDAAPPPAAEYGVEYSGPALDPYSPFGEIVYEEGWRRAVRNLLLFAGVHGFKGPTDLGLNGNFGFHEGLNWGAPLGDPWGHGYQVGFQALHSNFASHQAVASGMLADFDTADRNQMFFTAGLFRRPLGNGFQGGMAFDLFYDSYYYHSTLQQIRSETALVLGEYHEIGYWGAYGIRKETVTSFGKFDSVLAPTDMFAGFYRRRFTGGGQGRLWAGLSGNGDVIFGLDGTVPLGTNWALDNNFTCLFPKQGGSASRAEESWSVSIQLVWYPGRAARPAINDPYHPLFYVADNSWFLVDRR
jgi:hypothetical protein